VEHAFALELVDDAPQVIGEPWIVGGGQVKPFGDRVHAWIAWWRIECAGFQQASDDGLADAQEVDARVDQGVVEVEDDDWYQTAQGKRVAPNQWLDQ
jgi:hypothetical protein